MNYLIFEYRYEGHYTEYLRHLLKYALDNMLDDNIHCILSEEFKKQFDNGNLPKCDRFHLTYLSSSEQQEIKSRGDSHCIKTAQKVSEYIRRNDIDKTIFITASSLLIKVAQLSDKDVYLSAIQYIIPRYRDNYVNGRKSLVSKLKLLAHDVIDNYKFRLFATMPQIKALYLLNDEDSVKYYNKKYATNTFRFLPDPIDRMAKSCELSDNGDKITLLHAGKFHTGKGTFDIIDALKNMKDEERQRFRFILCGRSEIEADNTRASDSISELSQMMEVEFYNDFVEEEFLHRLYKRADYILIPYHAYWASSGNLGHAASYHKPVIGPERGLLGYLINKFHLGYTIPELTSAGIANVLKGLPPSPNDNFGFEHYTKRCNPQIFAKLLYNL